MRAARHLRRWTVCLLVLAQAGAWPSATAAQDSDAGWARLELRAGLGGHRAGLCSREGVTGAVVGLDLRTTGRWIASAAVDWFLGGQPEGCLDIERIIQYRGQDVRLRAGSDIGPRLSVAGGYALLPGRLEVTGGVGTVPTERYYDPEHLEWRLWAGTALTVRLSSGVGLQVEGGLHQVLERYVALNEDLVVADELYWEPMWRMMFSIPILR